jgi:hypothetical protein
MARILAMLLAVLSMAAAAADDGRLSFLEQEVRNLQRQVQSLSRQVDELTTRAARSVGTAQPPRASAPPADDSAWIDAGKWRRLRAGMSELEVIALLGPPTSMREEAGERVLFYAREIGASGFLGGSVRLRDRVVSEVRKPELQ